MPFLGSSNQGAKVLRKPQAVSAASPSGTAGAEGVGLLVIEAGNENEELAQEGQAEEKQTAVELACV